MRCLPRIWVAASLALCGPACGDNGNTIATENTTGGSSSGFAGNSGDDSTGGGGSAAADGTGGSAAGAEAGGSAGSGGSSGGTGGAAGTQTGGTGGTTGGSGGTGGNTGGAGGSSAGAGGMTGGTGGITGGTGGGTGGIGGMTGGTGGITGGTGGGTGGTGGMTGGTGGNTGGIGGTTGGNGGDAGGTGGSGGVDCPPVPACNWCGGDALMDSDGCITGWICANGVDPCEFLGCGEWGSEDCEADEVCGDDGLCWPDSVTRLMLGEFDYVANPCTTDPCLPGLVAAIVEPDATYILVVDGHWVDSEYDWETEWDFSGLPGQTVIAEGVVTYHTEIDGHVYLELELTSIDYRVG